MLREALIDRLQDEADLCRNDGAEDIAELLDAARAALAAPSEREQWQDIASAPKDGTDLILYSPDAREPYICIGCWVEFDDAVGNIVAAEWSDVWQERVIDTEPTHWMPLPQPPADAIERGEHMKDGR